MPFSVCKDPSGRKEMSEGVSPTKSRRGIPRAACRRLDEPHTLVLHHSDTVRAVLVSNRVFLQHSDTVRAVLGYTFFQLFQFWVDSITA